MKLRQKQPNPKKDKRHGVNLTATAALLGRHLIASKSGTRYYIKPSGQLIKQEITK